MNYVLSSHSISSDFKKEINEIINENLQYLSMAELKSLSPLKILKKLRSLNVHILYLAFEEDSSLSIKSTMELLALVSGADEIYTIQPQGRVDRVYRVGVFFQIFQFFLANIMARLIFYKSSRQLKKLMVKKRIEVGTVLDREVLYLKTNLWYGVKAGGSVGHVAGVINELKKKNWPITFASIEPPIMAEESIDFLEVEFPAQLAYPPELNNFVYHQEIVDKVTKVSRKKNYSFIYQRMSINNFSGVLLSQKLNIPLVLEYNGSEVWSSQNWGRPLIYERQAKLCEDVCLRHAHVIITVSEVLRDELILRGVESDKIVTYPNCVDPEVFTPQILSNEKANKLKKDLGYSEGDRVITFVGTFGKWHGVELLARSIRTMVDQKAEWLLKHRVKFLLVGDGFLMPEVRKEIDLKPYNQFSKLIGLVPQKEAAQYLQISDILLSPHVPNEDGSRFFGSPTKLFEYMAMAKPIIASDLEQLGDILKPCLRVKENLGFSEDSKAIALLVEAGSSESLIEGLTYLVENPSWNAVLGRNARAEVIDKYTWSHHVDAIISKLHEVAGHSQKYAGKSLIHRIFESQFVWARSVSSISFFRKVIDRLSTIFLVPSIGHNDVDITSRRGTKFSLRYPEDMGWESLIVYRDYETGTSDVFERILKEGDIVYDVGANLGWYTTLAAKSVGATGEVHAFEPVPKIYEKLIRNCALNPDIVNRVFAHKFALSDTEKTLELFSYEGLPQGLTSAKALYGEHEKVQKSIVESSTLDQIWNNSGRPDVKLIKVDVEGLEYKVILGAKQMIQTAGPIWLIEINYQTSEAFNWSPDELIRFLKENNNYKFMKVHEAWGKLYPLEDLSGLSNGDMIICYLPEKHGPNFLQTETLSH